MNGKQKDKGRGDQSARFIEAAKKTGADESGKAFEKALKKIIKVKPSDRRSRPS
jgi:hypothetical protein